MSELDEPDWCGESTSDDITTKSEVKVATDEEPKQNGNV
jgi:hypothetical protein